MSTPAVRQRGRNDWPRAFHESEVRVAIVAALCLLIEAILTKNVLAVHLDVISQLAAMWVWLGYTLVGRRDRAAERTAVAGAILATAAVLVVFAL